MGEDKSYAVVKDRFDTSPLGVAEDKGPDELVKRYARQKVVDKKGSLLAVELEPILIQDLAEEFDLGDRMPDILADHVYDNYGKWALDAIDLVGISKSEGFDSFKSSLNKLVEEFLLSTEISNPIGYEYGESIEYVVEYLEDKEEPLVERLSNE